MLLRMAIRAGEIAEPPEPKLGLVATGKQPTRMTEARARVLAAVAESGAATPKAALAALAACSTSVIDGLVADGALEAVALPPESGAALLDPGFRSAGLNADQRVAADDLIRLVADRAFLDHPPRRRDGIGQDRSLFRGGRRSAPAKAPGAGAAAGDCADRPISRSLCRALRRKAGRMAFRLDRAPARTRLDGGGGRGGARNCRRALGALSSVRRPRPRGGR